MPFARDKILINGDTCLGMWRAIKAEYKSLKRLSKEIVKMGKIKDTGHFRDAMQALCDAKLVADQKYIDGLRALKKDMAVFVDQHS